MATWPNRGSGSLMKPHILIIVDLWHRTDRTRRFETHSENQCRLHFAHSNEKKKPRCHVAWKRRSRFPCIWLLPCLKLRLPIRHIATRCHGSPGQIVSAMLLTSCNFFFISSAVKELPSAWDANPHCGETLILCKASSLVCPDPSAIE